MFEYFHIFYTRIYGALYVFFDKLSMRVKPTYNKYDPYTDDEIENIVFES